MNRAEIIEIFNNCAKIIFSKKTKKWFFLKERSNYLINSDVELSKDSSTTPL